MVGHALGRQSAQALDEDGIGKPAAGTWGQASKVRGPAGATHMSCLRAGWQWARYDQFITRQGLCIRVEEACPNDVLEMAKRDTEAAMWERWAAKEARKQLAPAPLEAPLRRL